MEKIKVRTFIINVGQPTQEYHLVTDEGQVLYYQPANGWKTEKGALRWALKHGYDIAD